MSFFPQIVEGPICRYGQTANQLWNVKQIEFENLKLGAIRILFGLMKKLVIADRLNPMIKQIFSHYDDYQGGIIALGAIAYTIQLYCDFSGTMECRNGCCSDFRRYNARKLSKTFLFKINFRILEKVAYHTRHMVQGLYLLSRHHVKADEKSYDLPTRKKLGNHFGPLLAGSIALVLCMVLQRDCGHGSAGGYIFFGMYHFVLILSGNIIAPAVTAFNKKLHINSECFAYKVFQIVRTGILVVIGEMFFRAERLTTGLSMFGKMVTDFSFSSLNYELMKKLKIDMHDV